MHDGTSEGEVLVEVILPVQSQHGLALHAVGGVVFQRHLHVSASIEDALVENGHLTGRIVHAIVAAFGKRDTSSGNHH